MASKQKRLPVSDWMYHAPSKGTTEVVGAPPPSQIPCLHGNEDLPVPDMPQKNVIKESDSAYIRLAKMGGREDLLRMRSPGPRSEGPVGYPRVDWYYQDDIQNEGEKGGVEDDKDYEFMLPDYMVHSENKNRSEAAYRPNGVPYAQDGTSVYEREGHNPNDKTVRIEEAKAAGYGVRHDKVSAASKKSQVPVERTPMCKPPSPQVGLSTKQPSPKEGNIEMGKLMSFGYLDDWKKDRDTWADKQQKYSDSHPDNKKADKMSTEYREQMMGKASPTKSAPKPSSPQKTNPTESAGSRKMQNGTTEDRPDFFKLSKFKNVPSKTSHRRTKGDSENEVAAH